MEVKNNIIYRPDLSTKYDEFPSLGHLMIANLTKAGDQKMLVSAETGETLSAIELVNKSIEIAKALTAAGVKQGDVVSIISENRFEFAFVLFGTIFLNCKSAPINNSYSDREIEHAMKLSKPKIVFASSNVSKSVVKIAKSLNFVLKVVLLDNENSADNKTVRMEDFTNPQILKDVHFEPKAVAKKTTVCLIMCSSGTTGLPKGVQISQSNLIVTIRNASDPIDGILSPSNVGNEEVVVLGLLPLFHVFGAAVLICSMASASAKIVLLSKFEERMFLSSIEKYRCNVAFLVPPLMVFLAKNELVVEYDISSLRFILSGAAPLSKEVETAVMDRLNNPKLIVKQGYGMTELTVGVLSQRNFIKPGSVGDVNPGNYAKVVDENGKAVGPNKRGELCFKGSVLMLGYIDDENATRGTIDMMGWLHTGDVGYYDEDLQFFIVDRIKELIKWKGFQVPPAEIEALLLTHEKIKDCGVIGKPDDNAGELPMAFVVKEDQSLTEEEIKKFVAERASHAKRLHGGVVFVDEIPKNPSGKILRRELRLLLKKNELQSKL